MAENAKISERHLCDAIKTPSLGSWDQPAQNKCRCMAKQPLRPMTVTLAWDLSALRRNEDRVATLHAFHRMMCGGWTSIFLIKQADAGFFFFFGMFNLGVSKFKLLTSPFLLFRSAFFIASHWSSSTDISASIRLRYSSRRHTNWRPE